MNKAEAIKIIYDQAIINLDTGKVKLKEGETKEGHLVMLSYEMENDIPLARLIEGACSVKLAAMTKEEKIAFCLLESRKLAESGLLSLSNGIEEGLRNIEKNLRTHAEALDFVTMRLMFKQEYHE